MIKTKKILAVIVSSVLVCIIYSCSKPKCPEPSVQGTINSWVPETIGVLNDLVGIYFLNEKLGYICGTGGQIIKTSNGGDSFSILPSGSSETLYDIYFTDTNIGYCIGNNGTILKTITGGTSWIAQTSPTSNDLRRIYFTDPNTGYITGIGGTLLKTIDAGVTWVPLNPGTSSGLYGIYFTDMNTGYISGQYAEILKTTNGGSSWTPLSSGVSSPTPATLLNSIYFTDSNTGYIVGGNSIGGGPSIILKTINAGSTWTSLSSPVDIVRLIDVKFTDSNTGYISGKDENNSFGYVLKTNDGGNNWTINLSYSKRLNLLSLPTALTGYVVGNNGTVLKGIQ